MGGCIWEAFGWELAHGRQLDGQVYMGVGGSLTGRLLPIDPEAEQSGREGGGGQPQQQGQVVMGKDRNKGLEETFPVVQSVPNIQQRCPNTSSALSLSQSPYLPVLVEERLATAWCRHMLLCQRAAAGSGWRLKALEAASGACSFPSH